MKIINNLFYFMIAMVRVSAEIKRTTSAETYLHGLRRFTNYSIQVLAYTATGDGKRSQPIHCITDEDCKTS